MAKRAKEPFQLSGTHWDMEGYRERMTVAQWRELLLRDGDRMIFRGHTRQLIARKLGAGVVEVSKKPLKEGV